MRPFSANEVRVAIKGLNGEGAWDLDCFLVCFFSELWKMVETEITH